MLGKKLINAGPVSSGVNTFASENFNTVLYTGNGGTQRIGGYINRGAIFNGSNSTITIPSSSDFDFANAASMSLFINRDTTNRDFIIDKANGGSGSYGWQFEFFGTTKGYQFQIHNTSNGAISNLETGANSTTGNWEHVVVTHNGSGEFKIYFNSVLKATQTLSGTVATNTGDVKIGTYQLASGYEFDGKLDQLRFFNKALSQSEIDTLYAETFASTTISTTDIFEDNSGVALYQLDGNANDTGINVATHTGKSLILSGNNASGQPYAYSANITNSSSYTIAAWIKFDSVSSNAFIFSKFENNVNENFLFQTSSGSLYGVIYTSASAGVGAFSNSALDIDRWYHIAFVVGGGTAKLYMDGVYVSQITYGGTARTSSRYIQFGWRSGGSTGINSPLDGLMEDVQFYNSALSAGDITTIYSNSTASGLVARWKFDDNLNDETGNYNATSTNTVAYSTDVPEARTIRKNGTASNITYQEATRFTPDLVWIKRRSSTEDHALFDSVRGIQRQISTNQTSAGYTTTNAVSSFDSTGFTTGNNGATNASGQTYVAWCFNAGSGSSASNTDGNGNTSTVKANQAAGFSIVKYTAASYQADGTATVGHGLGAKPRLILQKRLNSTQIFYAITDIITGSPQYIQLDTSAAANITAPSNFQITNSVFSSWESIGNTMIQYCFADVAGYQKIDTYAGGTTDKIIQTGFEPAFLLIKAVSGTNSGEHWLIYDNKRSPSNPRNDWLYPNLNNGENVNVTANINFLSNGFQLAVTSANTGINGASTTYLYLAIAADPDQTDPTVENSFTPFTWSGNGGTQSITGLGFKPDLVFWKANNASNYNWKAIDSIRGATRNLYPNLTNIEAGDVATTSFDEDGITFGSGGNGNTSSLNYTAYAWKAGDHDDSIPQINTEGTIQSIISVNDAAGFSIIKYTGNNTAGATIGHGLSSAPQLIIVKLIGGISAKAWTVYSEAIGNTKYLYLNTDATAGTYNFWNNTSPTSSVFSVSSDTNVNSGSGNYIAYCWYSVSGHSKIATFAGTNSTNAISGLGFAPRFVMIKNTTGTGPWVVHSKPPSTSNPSQNHLRLNTIGQEDSGAGEQINFDSDGFTINYNGCGNINCVNNTFLYMAFK